MKEARRIELHAAAAVISDAVVSHHSAALLHGLPELGLPSRRAVPNFTRAGDHHARGEELLISGSKLTAREVISINGLPVTSIARTAVDLARECGMPDGLAAMDAGARLLIAHQLGFDTLHDLTLEQTTDLRDAVRDPLWRRMVHEEFSESIGAMAGWKGVGWARIGAAHQNPAAESVMESFSRWRMIEAELPMPEIGCPIMDAHGVVRWPDFLWRKWMLIGEADGALKYGDAERIVAEKYREQALIDVGYSLTRWGWTEAVTNPHALVRRIRRALARAA